jgi:hypothetical protein
MERQMFDNITSFEAIRVERDTPRKQHEIHADLLMVIGHNEMAWQYINELENCAWEAGAEEALAWEDAFQQEPYAQ